jgi:hypothetical protein
MPWNLTSTEKGIFYLRLDLFKLNLTMGGIVYYTVGTDTEEVFLFFGGRDDGKQKVISV